MKTHEEILKSKGITSETRHHTYDYLYKSILECMQEVVDQERGLTEPCSHGEAVYYKGYVCKNCNQKL